MKKTLILAVLLLFLAGLAAPLFAQDTAYDVEGWKKRVAAPTYGVVVGTLSLRNEAGDELDTLSVPGFEMRIFNGTNVAKRGGFFVGYEVGTIFFMMSESDTYTVSDGEVSLSDFFAGTLFVLSKYGYRVDLGLKAVGVSLGVEAGMGLQVSMGGVDVVLPDSFEDDSTWVEVYAPFSLVLDAAGEAAFRLGQNFRLFARAGVMVMPQLVEINRGNTGLSDFKGEVFPALPNFRVGFALNY